MATKKSALRSFIEGMRSAGLIGRAIKCTKKGNEEGALRAYESALSGLADPRIDLERPECRSTASVALYGYVQLAQEFGREAQALGMLVRWRPEYLTWMDDAVNDEKRYLKWCEAIFQHLRAKLGPPLSG